jgi:hypothetical protein
MKHAIAICILFLACITMQAQNTGKFTGQADVGHPEKSGSATYDGKTKTYLLKGSGYNIWFERDEFHYLYKKMKGDFVVTAHFELLGKGTDPHRKTGWMIRESLADSASHISAVLHGDGLTVLQWRVKAGMKMRDPEDEIFAKDKGYKVLQIERRGNLITMRAAKNDGDAFETIGSHEMSGLPGEIYLGVYVCAHNPEMVEEAEVSEVKMK